MVRRYQKIYSPAIGREMEVLAYGHYGPPMIAFPTGGGRFFDWENHGMIDAIAYWLEAGKVKLYCPDGIDHESWLNRTIDPGSRARRHGDYEDFIADSLTSSIRADCQSPEAKIAVTGCSLGAFHAANFALKFPHLFNYALCMSGRYDLDTICGRSDSTDVFFNNPMAYTYHLNGEALDRVRWNTHLVLVCGQGAWEDICLAETQRLADLLAAKGISHERDLWGHDVEHHWYWWKKQIAHHLHKVLG